MVANIGAKASWITLKHAGSRGVGVPLPTCLGSRLYPPHLACGGVRDEGRGKEMKRERKDSQDESGHAEKKRRKKLQE